MLKEIAVEVADWIADACKRRARKWVERSKWWSDAAESMETGAPFQEVRKRRGEDADGGLD